LGDLGHSLDEEKIEEIGSVDILFVPVGGKYTINSKAASQIVSLIEPRVVIPMHYRTSGINTEVFGQLEDVEKFVNQMGIVPLKSDKFSVNAGALSEEMQLVVLERKA